LHINTDLNIQLFIHVAYNKYLCSVHLAETGTGRHTSLWCSMGMLIRRIHFCEILTTKHT